MQFKYLFLHFKSFDNYKAAIIYVLVLFTN